MAKDKLWIKKAIQNPGSFSKKAKKAGMTVNQLATKDLKKKSKVSSTTKKQAVLAKTLSKIRPKKKKGK